MLLIQEIVDLEQNEIKTSGSSEVKYYVSIAKPES